MISVKFIKNIAVIIWNPNLNFAFISYKSSINPRNDNGIDKIKILQRLKIDSIKATIREGLTLGYIDAFKSEKDRRVTMYTFDESILSEVTDYCFMMRRNRMLESASFISKHSTETINRELANAGMKLDWLESINKFISLFAMTAKNAFGEDKLPNVIPIEETKKRS